MTTTQLPAVQAPSRGTLFLFHYVLHLVLTLIPMAICLNFFLFVTPAFKNIFKDFKTALPTMTEWTMSLADLVRSGLWAPILLAALALPLLSALISSRQPTRRDRVIWAFFIFNIMFFLTTIFVILAAISLYLPLIKLVQSVSGGDSGRD